MLLKLLGVPSIVDVGGAYRWAAPGDVALVDADHGFLVVNPSKAEIASVRAQRKKQPKGKGHPCARPPSRGPRSRTSDRAPTHTEDAQ